MKTIAALSLLGAALGLTQPAFAQALDLDPLPWSAQMGVCGACLTLVGIVLFRTIPKLAAANAEAIDRVSKDNHQAVKEAAAVTAEGMRGLTTEVHGLRGDFQRATESQLELLQDAIQKR
jgi:hypothetical protein